MIIVLVVYLGFLTGLVIGLDRRMKAAQRRRESAHFQRSTGLLL